MEEKTKTPTIDEIQKSFEDYKKEKEEEIAKLKTSLDEEKRKVAQFSIVGVTQKVDTKIKEENVTFDFDF